MNNIKTIRDVRETLSTLVTLYETRWIEYKDKGAKNRFKELKKHQVSFLEIMERASVNPKFVIPPDEDAHFFEELGLSNDELAIWHIATILRNHDLPTSYTRL